MNDDLLQADFWEVGTFWHHPQGGKNILEIKKKTMVELPNLRRSTDKKSVIGKM